jgi:hypothetical protein
MVNPRKRQKGCGLCSPHKFKGHGDTIRVPWSVVRKIGKKRRWNRNQITKEERDDEQSCLHRHR